jgi:hypothetical protein
VSAADLVAQLAAAGTPPELLAAVAQELFCGEAERKALADRRRGERERKANQRIRSREVTGHAVKSGDKGSNDRDILTSQEPPIVISSEITPPLQNSNEVSPEHVIEAWNVMASEAGVPKAKMTPERRKKLKTFVKRHPADDITEAIWAVPRTPFLRGENPRGWKANIDFMLQPASFTKIIEGTYGE